jgi:hypothetical protein
MMEFDPVSDRPPLYAPAQLPTVAIAVVCICSSEHLVRCLEALRRQVGVAPFRVVVCHDPELAGIDEVAKRFPEARISSNPQERTPLELAAAALRACDEDVLLLTEDHCIPREDWVRSMLAARAPNRAVVGGRIEIRPDASPLDWAFYYVDFYRYAAPVKDGPSPTLTVCNVAYDRALLDTVRDLWSMSFEEPTVHDALSNRFGSLWLTSDSEVTMHRTVSFGEALRERYAFGRFFGHTRMTRASRGRRWAYAAFAATLPMLLLGRMTMKAVSSPKLFSKYLRAFGPVVALVLCWSWGEWLGYVTGRPPRRLALAVEQPSPNVTQDRDS